MNGKSLAQLATAIACLTVFACTISLLLPLLALNLEARGESSTVIGLLGALTGLGILIGAPLTPAVSNRFGAEKTIATMLCFIAVGCILYKVFEESLLMWLLIRALTSIAGALVFVIAEAAITANAPQKRRGIVLGVYASAFSFGFAIGPVILAVVGIHGWLPYVVAAGLMLFPAALVATVGVGDIARKKTRPPLMAMFYRSPLAFFCAFTIGFVENSAYDLLSVFARKLGLEIAAAALVVAAFSVGGMLQVPLGLAVDKLGARLALAIFCVVGVVGALALPVLITAGFWGMAGLAAWAACVMIFYPLGLNEVGASFAKNELLAVNAMFIVFYGLGTLVGPVTTGAAMDISPSFGMGAVFAALILSLLIYLGWDALKKRELSP